MYDIKIENCQMSHFLEKSLILGSVELWDSSNNITSNTN